LLSSLMLPLCMLANATADSTLTNYDEDPYVILVGEAETAIADGNYPQAAQRLLDALSVDPDRESNLLLQSNLAMVYSYMDQDSLALKKLDDLISRSPRMTTAIQNRAHVLMKLGDDIRAYNDFSTVLDIDSLNLDARYYHGMMALYGGRRDIAEADFAILEHRAPTSLDTTIALATLYSLTRQDSKALPLLRKLVDETPSPEYYSALVGCLLALENYNEASETIARGLKLYSHDPELYYYRAQLNRARYRLDEAHADAQRAIELGASPARVKAIFE
ncbi:MAG: hypothetical protein K2L80_05160, partial [Muribaculaceae bacterium]|nr:hypothetical protein [Muribaculaceae bacterium]